MVLLGGVCGDRVCKELEDGFRQQPRWSSSLGLRGSEKIPQPRPHRVGGTVWSLTALTWDSGFVPHELCDLITWSF